MARFAPVLEPLEFVSGECSSLSLSLSRLSLSLSLSSLSLSRLSLSLYIYYIYIYYISHIYYFTRKMMFSTFPRFLISRPAHGCTDIKFTESVCFRF